ncbi:hypothetical protein [Caballeronia sp. BR00000012568055]|jgi:hypothetical protein|nr:hypothetical protein [Caballeronia sp. BR00000012568055]
MTKPSQDKPHEDELLDEALDETFPASDPIAVDAEPEDNEERKRQKQ